jgi:trigger factor
MSITLKSIDPVRATITVAVKKEEYQPLVEKALNDIRKKTVMDGFRKGNVPKSRIQAMYGQSVLADELNKLVNDQLQEYIKEQGLDLLGDPILTEGCHTNPVYERPEDYEFSYDLGIEPDLNVKLTKADQFPYYIIKVEDGMIDEQIENYKSACGDYVSGESVEVEDVVKGSMVEQNGDLENDSATLLVSYIKNPDEQAKWIGAKVGDIVTFNPSATYGGNEAQVASFLAIKKEEVAEHTGDFAFTIKEIIRYKPAELGQKFYDKLYQAGTVTTEEELRSKVKDAIARQLAPHSDYKFNIDVKKALEDRAKDIPLPDEFLKRRLLLTNTDQTVESIDADYPNIVFEVKQHLISSKLLKEYDIQTTEQEVAQRAFAEGRKQISQYYGMSNVPDDVLDKFVAEMFKDQKNVQELVNQILESKLIAVLKEQVTLLPTEIVMDDFKKFFEKQKG